MTGPTGAEPPGLDPLVATPATLARASALLASGTFVSRALGFVSALVLAQTIGILGAGADTFTLANQLPNNIYAIIAGGLLNAVLVPQIVRAGLHADGGSKFINRVVTLGLVIFFATAAVATLCAPLLVRLYAQSGTEGFTGRELALATAFAYWCLPQILFYAVYSLVGEVLNARGVFGPYTWAPVLNNVIAIAGLLVFLALFGGAGSHQDAANWTPGMIALLAGSATLGIGAQAFALFFFWKRAGLTYRPEFRWRGVGLAQTGKTAAWTFGMILVMQIAGLVETNVATLASGNASVAVLRYAWLIFMLPHSVFAISIATPYFTRMSASARDGNLPAVRRDISASMHSILLVMVFSAAALIVVAFPFAAVFGGDYAQVLALGAVLVAFLPGLVPYSILFVVQRAFYSLEDTRTPFFIQFVHAGIFVTGSLVAATLPPDKIAVGLAVVLTIAGIVQTLVAGLLLRKKTGGLDGRAILRQAGWFMLAAIPTAAAGVGVLLGLGGFGPGAFPVSGLMGAVVSMALSGVVMLVVYVTVLALARNEELLSFGAPILGRLRRSR